MVSRLVLLPEALEDAAEAYRWYELRSVGLGDRFLDQVDACIDRICRNPELFGMVYKEFRRAIVEDFPYVICYKFDGDTVTVPSIFHAAQDPKKWRRRLK